MNDKLVIGKIGAPHGIKGEVKVIPLTNDPERFRLLSEVSININDEYHNYTISKVKYLGSLVILKFNEVDDRNHADELKNKYIEIHRSQGLPLKENEYYIADLLGSKVYEGERYLGKLNDVIQTGAADLYSVKNEETQKEILIPAISENILDVDTEEKTVTVRLPRGLEEL